MTGSGSTCDSCSRDCVSACCCGAIASLASGVWIQAQVCVGCGCCRSACSRGRIEFGFDGVARLVD